MSPQQIGTTDDDEQKKEIQNVSDAFQESSRPDIGNTCESVIPVKACDVSNIPMDTKSQLVLNNNGKATSQSKNGGDDQSMKDGSDDSDDGDENESDLEVIDLHYSELNL